MEAVVRHYVNPPAQEVLHVHQERAKRQTTGPGRQSDEQVDITRFIRVAASHRAEDADIAEAVSRRESSDLGSVGLDQGVHDRRPASQFRQGIRRKAGRHYATDDATERRTSFCIRMSSARATSHSRR